MRNAQDLRRQLEKIADVVSLANVHFRAESEMNAALHMASEIRPAPLATAIAGASDDLTRLIAELSEPLDSTGNPV